MSHFTLRALARSDFAALLLPNHVPTMCLRVPPGRACLPPARHDRRSRLRQRRVASELALSGTTAGRSRATFGLRIDAARRESAALRILAGGSAGRGPWPGLQAGAGLIRPTAMLQTALFS